MLRALNHPLAAIIVVLAFLWLAYDSYQHDKEDEASYPQSSIEQLNRLSGLATHAHFTQRQADVIMSLWHISDEELSKPVNIWGE